MNTIRARPDWALDDHVIRFGRDAAVPELFKNNKANEGETK